MEPRIHLLMLLPMMVAGVVGTLCVPAVNAWMNWPVGSLMVDGEVTDVDPWAAMFNDRVWLQFAHMWVAAFMVVGFLVAGVYAVGLLRIWSWLTGWVPVEGTGLLSLRHSSHHGPLVELCPEAAPKGRRRTGCTSTSGWTPGTTRTRWPGALSIVVAANHAGWGDLPWRVFEDPSGNEFFVLPSRG